MDEIDGVTTSPEDLEAFLNSGIREFKNAEHNAREKAGLLGKAGKVPFECPKCHETVISERYANNHGRAFCEQCNIGFII